MRINQPNSQKRPCLFRKTRKRIEMFFSQLCKQFMICYNYAETFMDTKNNRCNGYYNDKNSSIRISII